MMMVIRDTGTGYPALARLQTHEPGAFRAGEGHKPHRARRLWRGRGINRTEPTSPRHAR
jgi:hypothetical protein